MPLLQYTDSQVPEWHYSTAVRVAAFMDSNGGGRDMKDDYQCLAEMLIQAIEDSFQHSLRLRETSKTSVRMACTLF